MNAIDKIRLALSKIPNPSKLVLPRKVYDDLRADPQNEIYMELNGDTLNVLGYYTIVDFNDMGEVVYVVPWPSGGPAVSLHPIKRVEMGPAPSKIQCKEDGFVFMAAITMPDSFLVPDGKISYVRFNGEWFKKVKPSLQTFLQGTFEIRR